MVTHIFSSNPKQNTQRSWDLNGVFNATWKVALQRGVSDKFKPTPNAPFIWIWVSVYLYLYLCVCICICTVRCVAGGWRGLLIYLFMRETRLPFSWLMFCNRGHLFLHQSRSDYPASYLYMRPANLRFDGQPTHTHKKNSKVSLNPWHHRQIWLCQEPSVHYDQKGQGEEIMKCCKTSSFKQWDHPKMICWLNIHVLPDPGLKPGAWSMG